MDKVEIVGIKDTEETVATDLEMFRKLLDEARAGANVGVLLRGQKKGDVERGQVIAKPGTIKQHMKFKACPIYTSDAADEEESEAIVER